MRRGVTVISFACVCVCVCVHVSLILEPVLFSCSINVKGGGGGEGGGVLKLPSNLLCVERFMQLQLHSVPVDTPLMTILCLVISRPSPISLFGCSRNLARKRVSEASFHTSTIGLGSKISVLQINRLYATK